MTFWGVRGDTHSDHSKWSFKEIDITNLRVYSIIMELQSTGSKNRINGRIRESHHPYILGNGNRLQLLNKDQRDELTLIRFQKPKVRNTNSCCVLIL